MTSRPISETSRGSIIGIWKGHLARLLSFYETRRGSLGRFFPLLFLFFFLLNVASYWLAMVTAFPERVFGDGRGFHYFLVQFPVGFLGAVFDSLSFFVTIFIIRRALKAASSVSYLAHLSVDLGIAAVATGWVLFVFSFSGWLISDWLIGSDPARELDTLSYRNEFYQQRLVDALQNPAEPEHFKNLYFGLLMGVSAMLPSFTHLYLSFQSAALFLWARFRGRAPAAG